MERTYANKKMKQNKISIELKKIQEEKINNKIIVKIPTTGTYLLAEYNKEKQKWDTSLINSAGTYRRYIEKEIQGEAVKEIITALLSRREQLMYKKKKNIKNLIEIIKNIIKK